MIIRGLIFLLFCTFVCANHISPLKTEFEWKYFDYVWESPAQRKQYIDNGNYNHEFMLPIDVDRSLDGRTFMTVIGGPGVPASVHVVSNIKAKNGPLLKPYPSWSWYESKECSKKITSVFRVAIDRCNRIWVLDTGVISQRPVCPAQLLAFDLSNNRLIFQKRIPDNIAQNQAGKGLLITPIVETYGRSCQDTTVYIADVVGNALVLFDGRDFHRLVSDVYEPDSRYYNFTIARQSFELRDGVLGMALSPPRQPYGERYLFFRPLASASVYGADIRSLKSGKQNGGAGVRYIRGNDVLTSQASAMAFSKEGTLFYGMTREIAIGCWNMYRPLRPQFFKTATKDQTRLQFSSGMKILTMPNFNNEEQLLIMTNRLQKNFTNSTNYNEINFRILRGPVTELIRGTVCDKPQ